MKIIKFTLTTAPQTSFETSLGGRQPTKKLCLRPPTLLSLLFALFFWALPVGAENEEPGWLTTYNRTIYNFNETIDKYAFKPLAQGYQAITPEIVDQGISNFFSNIGDVIVIANDLMQLKFDQALQDTNRLLINSTIGIFGVFDLATPLGLPKHNEDFGQTLGYWGVGDGYFLMLPLLGPSSTRDIFRLPVDYLVNPVSYVDPASYQLAVRAVDLVDTRADLLSVEQAIGNVALDPYLFLREAYLQKRRNLVNDEAPTAIDQSADALFDELDEEEADAAPAAPE